MLIRGSLEGDLTVMSDKVFSQNKPVICLVSPTSRATSTVIPHSLLVLDSWLGGENIPSEIIDIKRNPYMMLRKRDEQAIIDEIIARLKISKPSYVGLTATTPEFLKVMELATKIKAQIGSKIIIGGVHASIQPEDFLQQGSSVDFVVVGDGEETLVELLRMDMRGESLNNVAGLAFRDGKRILMTERRQPFKDLDKLSMLAYHKIDMSYYTKPYRGLIRPLLLRGVHIFTTRGCSYSCTFCANRARVIRMRTVEKVLEEIGFLKNTYDIDGFYILDDTFCIEGQRVSDFTEKLQAMNLGLIWGAETRVNLINDRMLEGMRKSGCLQIDFGVESGSQIVLDRMKKGIKIEQIERAFALCHKNKIRTFANIMFNTPGETDRDVVETIKLLKRIKSSAYGINLTVPFPGTLIYEEYVKNRMTSDEYYLFEHPDIYSTIVDPRFRLAEHNMDLDLLYLRQRIRFEIFKSFMPFSLGRVYLRMLFTSRWKRQYFQEFWRWLWRHFCVLIKYGVRLVLLFLCHLFRVCRDRGMSKSVVTF